MNPSEKWNDLEKYVYGEHKASCMLEAGGYACTCGKQEAAADLARITAELKTKDEQVKAVTALINEWRFIAIERPMPTDRAIGYETCADELQAALNAALKQSS